MMGCVLGLDGGGTKTHALVLDLSGAVLGSGTAGSCSLSALSVSDALDAALAAFDMALAQVGRGRPDVRAVCAGVAGFSQAERRESFHRGLQARFPEAAVVVEPDYAVALTGATGGAPGIVVIAGTGSVAYGENGAGEAHRAGAYGYLIDDAGSGYGVGRAALAAVMRAADGTAPPTALTGRLLAAANLAALADIVPAVYGGSLDRLAIAALAPVVADAARENGDGVAQGILMRAGGALARLTEAVAARLFADASGPYLVTPIGSLWNAGPPLRDVFLRSLARFAPGAVLTPAQLPPAHGAALRALQSLS